jgi:hypothetical protein
VARRSRSGAHRAAGSSPEINLPLRSAVSLSYQGAPGASVEDSRSSTASRDACAAPAMMRRRCRTRPHGVCGGTVGGERPASLSQTGRRLPGARFLPGGRKGRPQDQLAWLATRRDGCSGTASHPDAERIRRTARLARASSEGNTPPRGKDYANERSARTADNAL